MKGRVVLRQAVKLGHRRANAHRLVLGEFGEGTAEGVEIVVPDGARDALGQLFARDGGLALLAHQRRHQGEAREAADQRIAGRFGDAKQGIGGIGPAQRASAQTRL